MLSALWPGDTTSQEQARRYPDSCRQQSLPALHATEARSYPNTRCAHSISFVTTSLLSVSLVDVDVQAHVCVAVRSRGPSVVMMADLVELLVRVCCDSFQILRYD